MCSRPYQLLYWPATLDVRQVVVSAPGTPQLCPGHHEGLAWMPGWLAEKNIPEASVPEGRLDTPQAMNTEGPALSVGG